MSMNEYFNWHPEGNHVFVNNTKKNDGYVMSAKYASEHCSELGFPPEANITDADSAITRCLGTCLGRFKEIF